jgi:hypothetical protein
MSKEEDYNCVVSWLWVLLNSDICVLQKEMKRMSRELHFPFSKLMSSANVLFQHAALVEHVKSTTTYLLQFRSQFDPRISGISRKGNDGTSSASFSNLPADTEESIEEELPTFGQMQCIRIAGGCHSLVKKKKEEIESSLNNSGKGIIGFSSSIPILGVSPLSIPIMDSAS